MGVFNQIQTFTRTFSPKTPQNAAFGFASPPHFSPLNYHFQISSPNFDYPFFLELKNRKKKSMPLYDCMLMFKPRVQKESLLDLVVRVGKHVYRKNGVVTDVKSFGTVQLGYGIKKLDGRYFQGQLMQMTVMATPNINKELHYLNKEDRLLRWLLVKHRDVKYGLNFLSEDDPKGELSKFPLSGMFGKRDDDDEEDEDDDDEEYDMEQEEKKTE